MSKIQQRIDELEEKKSEEQEFQSKLQGTNVELDTLKQLQEEDLPLDVLENSYEIIKEKHDNFPHMRYPAQGLQIRGFMNATQIAIEEKSTE